MSYDGAENFCRHDFRLGTCPTCRKQPPDTKPADGLPPRTYWIMDTHLDQLINGTQQQVHLAISCVRADESKFCFVGKTTKAIAWEEHERLVAEARAKGLEEAARFCREAFTLDNEAIAIALSRRAQAARLSGKEKGGE